MMSANSDVDLKARSNEKGPDQVKTMEGPINKVRLEAQIQIRIEKEHNRQTRPSKHTPPALNGTQRDMRTSCCSTLGQLITSLVYMPYEEKLVRGK